MYFQILLKALPIWEIKSLTMFENFGLKDEKFGKFLRKLTS
jgi:hypothetical protein